MYLNPYAQISFSFLFSKAACGLQQSWRAVLALQYQCIVTKRRGFARPAVQNVFVSDFAPGRAVADT